MAFSDEGIEIKVPAPNRTTVPDVWPEEAPVEPVEEPVEEPANV